jgi:hypothetical protein
MYGKGATRRPGATCHPNDFQKFFTARGYSEGSDHTLQVPRWHLYLFIAGILKLSSLLLAAENGDSVSSGSEN